MNYKPLLCQPCCHPHKRTSVKRMVLVWVVIVAKCECVFWMKFHRERTFCGKKANQKCVCVPDVPACLLVQGYTFTSR